MEKYEDIIQELIDFINQQSGVYMDSMAGFSGHKIRVERQVARVLRPTKIKADLNGGPVIVHTSYEVSGEPDVIMHRTIRASDFLNNNSESGANEKQQVCAILVFIYTFWEKEFRPRLASCKQVGISEISSEIMGDIRILRNAILHEKRMIKNDKWEKLRKINDIVVADKEIHLPYENMHRIFVLIKQDLARMLVDHYGANDGTVKLEEIVSVAVQKKSS